MDKKKQITKAGSSAKTEQVPVKKAAAVTKKTAKKISPVKTEKKREVEVKAIASRTKTAFKGKTTPAPQAITSEKKTAKEENIKAAKKSAAKPAAAKAAPERTVKAAKPKEAALEKPGKGVAGKSVVKTTKGVRVAAKTEAASKKEKRINETELKAVPKRKSAVKGSPSKIKETTGERLKPKEKAGTPLSASRKVVKKKIKAPALKGPKKTKGIQEKTAAAYAVPLRRKIKPKRSFDLRVFLPEEELPEEAPIISLPELPEEYGENELLLMEVDPSRVFASWEIKPEDIAGETGKLILRVYDVTGIDLEKVQSARFFDIPIRQRVDSKFFDIKMPGRDVIMEIGLLYPEGSFKAIKRSHRVSMPALQSFEELGITGLLSDSDSLIGY